MCRGQSWWSLRRVLRLLQQHSNCMSSMLRAIVTLDVCAACDNAFTTRLRALRYFTHASQVRKDTTGGLVCATTDAGGGRWCLVVSTEFGTARRQWAQFRCFTWILKVRTAQNVSRASPGNFLSFPASPSPHDSRHLQ